MVILLRIDRNSIRKLDRRLKNVKKLPDDVLKGMRKWGMGLVKDLIASARQAGIKDFRNNLLSPGKGIRWNQRPKGEIGELFMRQYGLFLDRMSPHFVNIKSSRPTLIAWGKQAVIPDIRKVSRLIERGQVKKHGIMVKPHPFINTGFNRSRGKLKSYVREGVSKNLRRR